LVRDCTPDDIGISVSYPMPGTRFYEAVREQLGEKQNWQDSSDLAMLYNGPFTTAFYRKLYSVIHKEFRARKAWIELKSRFSVRTLARLAYNFLTLFPSRWQLGRLAVQPEGAILALPNLPPDMAAQPTPQDER